MSEMVEPYGSGGYFDPHEAGGTHVERTNHPEARALVRDQVVYPSGKHEGFEMSGEIGARLALFRQTYACIQVLAVFRDERRCAANCGGRAIEFPKSRRPYVVTGVAEQQQPGSGEPARARPAIGFENAAGRRWSRALRGMAFRSTDTVNRRIRGKRKGCGSRQPRGVTRRLQALSIVQINAEPFDGL